jgi:hypothetical protein
VGEFGCYERADAASRLNFHRAIREAFDEQGLGWAMWDWKAGFHYWKNGAPEPAGMREAMFPAPVLSVTATGELRATGAIGKTYVVERADSLAPPAAWEVVQTAALTNSVFEYQLPANPNRAAIYRVLWRK